MYIDLKDKLTIELPANIEELNAKEIWKVLYGKELNTKKNILEYIDITKVLKQNDLSSEIIQETYTYIYDAIEKMSSIIKVNTKMYLKNQLM